MIKSGVYSLYKKKWAANDPEAQYQNMVDMFSDLSKDVYKRQPQATTNSQGVYTLENISIGTHIITFTKADYQTVSVRCV